MVRAHECCSCGLSAPSEPHHCAPAGISAAATGAGMSMKADDHWTIPLCRTCHRRWHDSNTYRQLGMRSVMESDDLMARVQLLMMSAWIRMLDADAGLF